MRANPRTSAPCRLRWVVRQCRNASTRRFISALVLRGNGSRSSRIAARSAARAGKCRACSRDSSSKWASRGWVGQSNIARPRSVSWVSCRACSCCKSINAWRSAPTGGGVIQRKSLASRTPHCANSSRSGAKSASRISGLRAGLSRCWVCSLHRR